MAKPLATTEDTEGTEDKTGLNLSVPRALRGEEVERTLFCVLWLLVVILAAPASAQTTRLAVLQAEDRRADTAADLATIRAGARSADAQTARIAVRALGRLERPALIPDILPALRNSAPDIRAEAATALGQAAQGWTRDKPSAAAPVEPVVTALVSRLKVEADPDVRSAICETIGRLPYSTAAHVDSAERALLDMASRAQSVADRLGVVKGFEALTRTQRRLRPPGNDAIALLRRLAMPAAGEPSTGARIRRLSLEALIAAGAIDDELVGAASRDADAQVRRLAMRAATAGSRTDATDRAIATALADDSPIVRIDALRAFRARRGPEACAASVAAAGDRDVHVALVAIDQLSDCGASPDAIDLLDRAVSDLSKADTTRAWHRAAHAVVALAVASPERGRAALATSVASQVWQVRMYSARAATTLGDGGTLDTLARDEDDNVREAAVDGLKKVAGHSADAVFVAQLTRPGYQVLRAAASALDGTPDPETVVPALRTAWQRLVAEGRDNSHDARDAIAKALTSAGADPRAGAGGGRTRGDLRGQTGSQALNGRTGGNSSRSDMTAEELRRLASPRARISIRDVGTFDVALFTVQAPASVLRFVHLAESGYYNGLTFHRIVPNFVIQGGSPGANEYIGDAAFMRDEVGLWPHVRGAVGISTRSRDTGDAQIFIDLIDNPRLDHEYTVFAQVLNGIEIVDRILEGDVIERIEIVPGS